MTGAVLVLNSGSSSLKYAVVDPHSGARQRAGTIERIGEPGGEHPDHAAALAAVGSDLADAGVVPTAVGHRVVHGGDRFHQPAVIDDSVVAAIAACVPLAPLHNPAALAGITAARKRFPDVPQVAVFDTAFHADLPAAARTYAIDRDVAAAHGLYRYGFHGTSHQFVAREVARTLGRPEAHVNSIVLHLGNGASACAVRGGRSVDTSMGVTPMEGLVMGTRSGDVDPGLVLALLRAGWTPDAVDDLLNRRSGLLGLSGHSDAREVAAAAAAGSAPARLARDVMVHRLRKYVGAYCAVLERVDALAFTAGIGEHDAEVRERVCAGLGAFGIALDPVANRGADPGVISAPGSSVTVLVVPTDEEWAIASECALTLGGQP